MVSSARSLLTWGRRRFGEELADLETGLQADRICAGEQKVQREGLKYMFRFASGAESQI
jgi:hypothetical protein